MKKQAHDERPRVLIVDDTRAIHETIRGILDPSTTATPATDSLDELEADLFDESPVSKTATSGVEDARFVVESAFQGQEALAMVQASVAERRNFAMAFVDMRMPPGWDGLETIEHLWRADRALQIVICTAYSDRPWREIRERLGASHQLLILKKPFEAIEVAQIADALTAKWTAARAERALLRGTLGGTLEVLGDLLALVTPSSSERTRWLRPCVAHVVRQLGLTHWAYDLAAGFSQIGCMMVPAELASEQREGRPLSDADRDVFERHPRVAAKIIRQIPRMRIVASIVDRQLAPLPVRWEARDEKNEEWVVAAGSQILNAALVLDTELHRKPSLRDALDACSALPISPVVMNALETFRPRSDNRWCKTELPIELLKPGMVFEQDVASLNGMLVCPANTKVTAALLERLRNFEARLDNGPKFHVRVPAAVFAKLVQEEEAV